MNRKLWIILGITIVLTTLLGSSFAQEGSQQGQDSLRVLRLDSYHPEFPWSAQIHQGVITGLADNGYTVEDGTVIIDEYYMDTKRNTSDEYFEKVAEETIAYIQETQPDIVIASDDNAARLVVSPMKDAGIYFVLLGVNGRPEKYDLLDSPMVTGVLERPHVEQMMAWIEQVFGEGAQLKIMAEDSPTSEGMFGEDYIGNGIETSTIGITEMIFTSDYAIWQEHVLNADETSDVLFLGAYATLRDENNQAVEPVDTLAWTVENSPIPVMGFWEEAVHDGTLGGPVISGYNQGYEAANRAVQILNGTSPLDFGFSVPSRGKLIINKDAIAQWDVKIPLSLLEVSEIVGS